MKQYNAIKARHPGALLLFRVGDFYETFGEDAVKASQVLDIVLTKRANGASSHIELAGFPHHSLDSYLPKLVRSGYRVAVCDQLEDPKAAKGIVKRGITELVTPGLTLNDKVLEKSENNYLASIFPSGDIIGISFLDLSTGEFLASSGTQEYIDKLLQSLKPAEVVFSKGNKAQCLELLNEDFHYLGLEDWVFAYDYAHQKLTEHFGTQSLKGFGIDSIREGIIAAGAILHYLEDTEHKELEHITSISRIEQDQHVWLDKFTIRNLELVAPQQEGGIPLMQVLDKTICPMGARLISKWVLLPLKDLRKIEARLNIVEALVDNPHLLESLQDQLKPVGDLERIISKVAVNRVNPREMGQLKTALNQLPLIELSLTQSKSIQFKELARELDLCQALAIRMENELNPEPPLLANQGNVINEGVNEELDQLRQIAFSGKDFLAQLQRRETENTGISSLKVAYNKVFGYYLEVTHAHKDKVPQNWIRKQTLVNAERYITEELKEYEEKILTAEDKIAVIESGLYQALVEGAREFLASIQMDARILAQVDCYLSLAQTAIDNNYIKPEINNSKRLDIKKGRHPVIEWQLPPGEEYVPNDLLLDNEEQQILIITGPNMSGKSALLRQTALIVLMAQMGSFVPAAAANIGIVDKVFTRVGASDNLSRGESTFMVEMIETASILNNLSDRSLILMDEIGRGTSTYDGISIAWAIVEHLHNHPRHKAKTLFATHYHELSQLENDLRGVQNYNVSVKEVGKKVIFLRKLEPGSSQHSFGIHVAQMAGMPNPVVIRANQIMGQLEKDKIGEDAGDTLSELPSSQQLNLFELDPNLVEVKKILDGLDINTISPVEALLKLNEIQTLMRKK